MAFLGGICPNYDDPRSCPHCNVAVVEVHDLASTAYVTVHEMAHG